MTELNPWSSTADWWRPLPGVNGVWNSLRAPAFGAFTISLTYFSSSLDSFGSLSHPRRELGGSGYWHRARRVFSSPASTSGSRKAWIVVPRDHSISLSNALRHLLMSFKQSSINSSSLHSRTITPARRIGETIQSEAWQPLYVYMETNNITNKEGMWKQTISIQYLCQFPRWVETETERKTRGNNRFVGYTLWKEATYFKKPTDLLEPSLHISIWKLCTWNKVISGSIYSVIMYMPFSFFLKW
jgi:hypothetical protein